MSVEETSRGFRYARWLERRWKAVLWVSLLLSVILGWLSASLPVRADFSNLLPPSERSVRDLRALQARTRAFATLFVVVESADPQRRSRAVQRMYEQLRALDGQLVAHVAIDERRQRQFFWDNRFLFAELPDLQEARDALRARIARAKIEANPLFVDLGADLEEERPGAGDERLDELLGRLGEAERKARDPGTYVSRDGRLQLLVVRATFPSSDVSKGEKLVNAVEQMGETVRAELGGDLRFGLTGDVYTGLGEFRSILRGMVTAALATVALCALGLLAYFRSLSAVIAALFALVVGSLATFGVTRLTIGHLNLATAFLAAIVVGNGINASLIFLARYFEELRRGQDGGAAMGRALSGASRGTLAAALTAGVAYASLMVTDFRGFRHFGMIGALGMVMCWITAFTTLPAALIGLFRAGLLHPRREPGLGRLLARLLPGRHGAVVAVFALLTLAAGLETWRYLVSDPLEEDWRKLRSEGAELDRAKLWDTRIKREFAQSLNRGVPGRFAVAVPERAQARVVAEALRAADRGVPPAQRTLDFVVSLDDLVPRQQPEKLAVLAEIRELLTGEVLDALSPEERRKLEPARPPEKIARIEDADVPEELAWPFVERDGSRGRIVLSSASLRFDDANVRDLVTFAGAVRAIELPPGAIVGGQAFMFADMLAAMERDGPRATLAAIIGSLLAVWLVLGMRRHGVVTLLCTLTGTLAMIAVVAAMGVKINFLDFIALPITVGIGIDYAVNMAAREREDWRRGPRHLLATTGGAVLLCSYTTMVGYGSLLLSDNPGIRSFGLAAIVGEVTCVLAALAFAPSLLFLLRSGGGDATSDRAPGRRDADQDGPSAPQAF
jgi:hypothetical protein